MKAKSARGASTRRRILEAAAKLMKKNGVNGTSVDDVLSASNAGKSQFYHYFTSKDGLVKELVGLHLEAMPPVADEALSSLTDLDKLDAWLEGFVEGFKVGLYEDGCPIGTMASELASQNELLRVDLHAVFVHWEAKLAQSLRVLRSKGQLKPDVAAEALAGFIMASLQGALLMAKTARSEAPLRATIQQLKQHVRSQTSPLIRRSGASSGRSLPLGFCP